MSSRFALPILLILLLLCSQHTLADQQFTFDQATVSWRNVDQYRDIKAADQSQARFEERVLKTLSDAFAKTAEQNLSAGQMLKIEVTDLDLAGEVRFRAQLGKELRVLNDVTPPRITFSYQIMEGDTVIHQGDEKLSNLGYLSSVIGPAKDRPFAYEKKLIEQWGKKAL